MYPRKTLIIFLSLVVINCLIDEIDGKRGIAIARRAKGSGKSYSSRRGRGQDHHPDVGSHSERSERHAKPPAPAPAPAPAASPKIDTPSNGQSNTQPIGWNVNNNNKPVGPPPPYPGLGGSGTSMNGPPPSYGQAVGAPPSYPATYGSYGYPQNTGSNIQRIPQRGQPGAPSSLDTTAFHGLGSGHNAYGGPSHTGGLYNNQFHSAGGGLYNNHNQPGMTPNNAWGAPGGGYGQGYGYDHRSNNPLSFGNVLTGLALWNVARGFNSYPSHQQHVHYHGGHDSGSQTQSPTLSLVNPQISVDGSTQPSTISPQTIVNTAGAPSQPIILSTARTPVQPTIPATKPPIAGKK